MMDETEILAAIAMREIEQCSESDYWLAKKQARQPRRKPTTPSENDGHLPVRRRNFSRDIRGRSSASQAY